MRGQRRFAGGRAGRVRRDRRYLHHQYRIWRPRPAGCLYHAVGNRAAGEDALGAARTATAILSAADARRESFDRADRLAARRDPRRQRRSEEHTSELQSLMRISYAVFCLKKKKYKKNKSKDKQKTHRQPNR